MQLGRGVNTSWDDKCCVPETGVRAGEVLEKKVGPTASSGVDTC